MRAGGEAGQLVALTWRLPCADPGQKRRSERRPRTVVCCGAAYWSTIEM